MESSPMQINMQFARKGQLAIEPQKPNELRKVAN
jgi:hypothetical protein